MAPSTAIPLDRIALTVGVVGHREFPSELDLQLRSAFATILTTLSQAHPNSPVVVLSTLATGAEILAAEVAQSLDVPVVACLPRPAEAYGAGLSAPARTRFSAALERCSRVDLASSAPESAAREFEAGLYIARYSHLMVAFWDGETGRSDDPTAGIVRARLSGAAAVETALADLAAVPDAGPVYHIVTHARGEGGAEVPASVVKLFPRRFSGDEDFERDFARALASLDQYNRDLDRAGPRAGAAPTIDALRERTGAVANELQTTTFRFLYVLYVIAILATAAQYTTSQLLKYAMFPIAFGFYRIAKRFDYENRYQDYRALSEGLRVQEAWFSAGLSGEQVDRCYLGMQEKELQWIRMALRYAYFAFHDAAPSGQIGSAGTRAWIESQWHYFQTKPRREEQWLARLKLGVKITFWIAVAVSLAIFAFLYLPTAPQTLAAALAGLSKGAGISAETSAWLRSLSHAAGGLQARWDSSALPRYANVQPAEHAWLARLSTGALALYAAIALLISNYCDKRAFAQNVKRYDRMFVVFDRAKQRLAAMPDPNTAPGREVVRDLGRAALIENADWLLTRRERPLAFVT